MIRTALACLTFLLFALPAHPQDAVHALESALKGKQMELRNYSADKTARYSWADTGLIEDPVQTHTLAVFVTQSVKLKNGKVIVKGERSTLARDPKDSSLGLYGKAPVTLEVDLKGADPTVVLPQLIQKLFFSNAKDAVSSLPKQVAFFLSVTAGKVRNECSQCLTVFEDGRWARLKITSALTPPVTVSAPTATYPETAREAKASGIVTSIVYISDIGQVSDIWLAQPLGYGLGEASAEALRRYVFKPAQHNGLAVGTEAMVETKFQIN